MATTTALALIDVRLSPGEGDLLDTFDALPPGQSLLILADVAPRDLLQRLQADRKGLFEWSVLEAGPSCFRVQVTRRRAAAGAHREIGEALGWDHDRLDALERKAFECLAAGDATGSRAAWGEFVVGLMRHIRFEEEILFPAFEEAFGVLPEAGPTAVMRAEHREIEAILEALGRALAGDGDPAALREDLHRVLGGHNLKEERVLYPSVDRALEPEERDALFARIQAR